MNMRAYRLLFVITSLATLVSVISCRKNDRSADNETQSSKDNSISENIFADIEAQLHEVASVQADVNKTNEISKITSCVQSITVTPALPDTTFPKTLVIDYGNAGSTACTDGSFRRGKIIAVFSGKYQDSATTITISFSNYYVNNYLVEGTKTITNNGHNSQGNLTYSIKVTNATITSPAGKKISWSANRTREWIAGASTAIVSDDEYLITGTAKGTSSNGNNYTITILDALRKKMDCRWLVSGKLSLQPQNLAERIIDYGNGDCDNQVVITVNGKSYTVDVN